MQLRLLGAWTRLNRQDTADRTSMLHKKLDMESLQTKRPVTVKREQSLSSVRFSIIRDFATLVSLAKAWDALFSEHAQSHHIFQNHAWLRTWSKYYLKGSSTGRPELAIIVGWQDERLLMVLPLVTTRSAGLIKLQWMGAPVSQYGDALITTGKIAPILLHTALAIGARETGADLLDLSKVREDAAIAPVLSELGAQIVATRQAPYIDLSRVHTRDAYLRRFSSNNRKQKRRRRRRLEEIGLIDFVCHSAGTEASRESVLAIRHKRRAKLIAQRSKLDRRFEFFFEELCGSTNAGIGSLVSVLSCGGHAIAREIGLTCKEGYFSHVGVFDRGYSRYGPGALQMDNTIAQCIELGTRSYDLLAPADDYKVAFADGAVTVRDYLYPLTRRGTLYANLALKLGRPFTKNFCNRAIELGRGWQQGFPKLSHICGQLSGHRSY